MSSYYQACFCFVVVPYCVTSVAMRTLLTVLLLVLVACHSSQGTGRRMDDATSTPDGGTWSPSDAAMADAQLGSVDAGELAPSPDAGRDAGPKAPECTADKGCPGGVCENNMCGAAQCSSAAECGDGKICRSGRCVALPCGGRAFVYDPMGRTLTSVAVAGTFNGWNKDAAGGKLAFDAQTKTWRGRVELGEGTHQYKLVLNGAEWVIDPSNPDTVSENGSTNSKVVIDCPFVCEADTSAFDWRHKAITPVSRANQPLPTAP